MTTAAITTITKMMETLPESVQDQAVEYLRKYLAELEDDAEWDDLFEKTEVSLIAAAKKAKEEMAAGKSKPMDFNKL